MRIWAASKILILIILSNIPWESDAHTWISDGKTGTRNRPRGGFKNVQRRAVTEDEISYIASTLQPRECLSLLYLLHHGYKRRRRRNPETKIQKVRPRSAQITPCETMLLNYWRDPSSRNHRDFSRVSRTLRQVKRQDLARWLCGRKPSCFSRDGDYNGTNDASSMTAQMQVIPIYASRALPDHETSIDSTLDAMIWIYIALAVSATAAVLLCVHYLFKKFRKPSQYVTLADKRSVQHACRYTDNNEGILPCSKKNRYPQPQSGCGCSSN